MIARTELEYSLLGALIGSAETQALIPQLYPEDFGDSIARSVMTAIREMFNSRAPIDPLTVKTKLGTEYENFIDGLLQVAVTTTNAAYYAELLHERATLDKLKSLAADLSAAEAMADTADTLSEMNMLTVSRRQWQPTHLTDAFVSFTSRHESKDVPEYLEFGFQKLDRLLFLQPGDLCVIGGQPSSGKTMLALQMARKLARKHRVGFFSLETSEEKLTDRMMSQMTRIPLRKIKMNDLTDPEWQSIFVESQKASKLSLDLIRAAGMTAGDIRAFAVANHYDVVFVDYLQIVRADARFSRYEAVTEVSMALHTMAQQNGIAVIALAQLSRPEKNIKNPAPPNMNDLRESGQIEQDADAVLILYNRDRDNPRGPRMLKVAKNKEGEREAIELKFDGEIQTFSEAEPEPPTYAKTATHTSSGRRLPKSWTAGSADDPLQSLHRFEQVSFVEGGENPFEDR